jgi:epoxyqueuosine reductase QueG
MDFELYKIISKFISVFETERKVSNMWKPPLVAVLSAEDPLIPELKQAVSPDHLLPTELLPDAKSIIVFFLPFSNRIVDSNLEGEAASEEWAKAYFFTNGVLGFINDGIEKHLKGYGFQAAKITPTHNFDKNTLMSRWSHRHIARIAGLGSFGINNMLITSFGCCGRFGSIVTNVDSGVFGVPVLEPASEKCLSKVNGSCGLCRNKCKFGAMGEGGTFDRHKCYAVCQRNGELYKSIGLADSCGKCLVGLPCSITDPSCQ